MFGDFPQGYLESEATIVWLDDPQNHRYVRETLEQTTRPGLPSGKRKGNEVLVGYALIDREKRVHAYGLRGTFWRRVFIVRKNDPYKTTGCPCEGVDPLTVKAGVAGDCTDRAWGGPIPKYEPYFPNAHST